MEKGYNYYPFAVSNANVYLGKNARKRIQDEISCTQKSIKIISSSPQIKK